MLTDSDAKPRAARPGEFAPEQLGSLGLRVGDKLLYNFDFGDNHVFELMPCWYSSFAGATAISAPSLKRRERGFSSRREPPQAKGEAMPWMALASAAR